MNTAPPLFPMTGANDVIQTEPFSVKAIKKKPDSLALVTP
jgi:hypothetical protein